MLKAVIFDMDGVIIDSEPLHAEAGVLAAKKYGVDITTDYCYQFIGSTDKHMLEVMIDEFHLDVTIDEFLEENHRMKAYLEEKDGYPPIPFVPELMKALYEEGYLLAIASSSPMPAIEATVSKLNIGKYLTKLVSGRNVAHPKPAPDVFLKAAEELGIAPDECLVIEDSCNGLNAAKAAGMSRVAFFNPHSGNQDLSVANVVILGFEEITPDYLSMIHQHAFRLPATILHTNRLIIRELCQNDLPDLIKIINEPSVAEFSGEPATTLADAQECLAAYIDGSYHLLGFGLWGIFLKENEQLIGRIGIEMKEARPELGYLLAPEYQHKGYAMEALNNITEYAKYTLEIPELFAVIDNNNQASLKIADALHMTATRTIMRDGHTCTEYKLIL